MVCVRLYLHSIVVFVGIRMNDNGQCSMVYVGISVYGSGQCSMVCVRLCLHSIVV